MRVSKKRPTQDQDEKPFAWMEPFKAPGFTAKINAGIMNIDDVQNMIAESENPAVAFEIFLKTTNTAELIKTGYARHKGNKKGGKKNADRSKEAAEEWHAPCAKKARELLAQGKTSRELAGILATQFERDRTTINRVLKKAGVK